jgi:hypothetical protein
VHHCATRQRHTKMFDMRFHQPKFRNSFSLVFRMGENNGNYALPWRHGARQLQVFLLPCWIGGMKLGWRKASLHLRVVKNKILKFELLQTTYSKHIKVKQIVALQGYNLTVIPPNTTPENIREIFPFIFLLFLSCQLDCVRSLLIFVLPLNQFQKWTRTPR